MTTELIAIVGLVTGALGTMTGIASLIWQISAHRGTGRVVSVKTSYMMPVYGPPHAPEFRDDDQVAIEVTNKGGAPVTVTNYGVRFGGRGSGTNLFVSDRHPASSALPAIVNPGGEPVQVMVPVADLRRISAGRQIPFSRMRPWVDLGDGRRVYANKSVPLK